MPGTAVYFNRPAVFASASAQPETVFILRDPSLAVLITDAMDLRTLGRWRATCRAAHIHATRALRRTLTRMLFRFFPCTREFLRYLTDHRAVLGGEAALAFFLRDPAFEPRVLEVYTGYGWFQPFIDNIPLDPILSDHLQFEGEEDVDYPFVRLRGVRKYCVFSTTGGRRVIVFESASMSPCTPIGRSWCTAMMNFVNDDCFGSAYPHLIENNLALVSDLVSDPFHEDEEHTMDRLIGYGFSFSAQPSSWPQFYNGVPPRRTAGVVSYPCRRDRFVCPDQARFFGDGGSIVGLIDPANRNFDFLRERFLPPFGHMPVWRMWNSTVCDGGCAYADPILPRGIISITTIYADQRNPFALQVPTDHDPRDYRDLARYVDVAAGRWDV